MATWKFRIVNQEAVVESMVRGLQKVGDNVLRDAQINAPVLTGELKRSGSVERLSNGVVIRFTVPYARRQEEGIPAGTTERVRKHPVKEHKRHSWSQIGGRHGRRVSVGKTGVEAHTRGPFTRRYDKAIPGKYYLRRAWDKNRSTVGAMIKVEYEGSKSNGT